MDKMSQKFFEFFYFYIKISEIIVSLNLALKGLKKQCQPEWKVGKAKTQKNGLKRC